jgi:tryptophan synthase alpha subunit
MARLRKNAIEIFSRSSVKVVLLSPQNFSRGVNQKISKTDADFYVCMTAYAVRGISGCEMFG